jgi:LacI family transcriptional regulator
VTVRPLTIADAFALCSDVETTRYSELEAEDPRELEIAFAFTSSTVADDQHAFYGPLVSAARRRAFSKGLSVVLIAPSRDSWLEASSLERSIDNQVGGLVVFGGSDGNPDVLRSRWPGLATVFVEYDTLGDRSAHVGIDNERAFSDVVLHLATLKRSRIATITGRLDNRPAAERLAGYRAIVERMGYGYEPELVSSGDWSVNSGYDGMKRLLALGNPPDAVACACDVQAVGAMQAIEEAGLRIPEDIAVTGFDDADFAAALTPSLTTVRQPATAIGESAIDSLIAMIDDPSLDPPIVMEPAELVVRESCGGAAATSNVGYSSAA